MATYIVFTKESTQDQNELNIYHSKVRETLEGHPVKLHAAYGPQQVLEGPAPEGVVILESPTTTAARKWYDGSAYQAIVQHRFKGVEDNLAALRILEADLLTRNIIIKRILITG
jgi:uncharacterized protein (DUF1330 family)